MSLQLLQSLTIDQGERTWTVAWNPSGTLLASSGADKIIRIWAQESENGKWSCSSKLTDTHTKSVRRLSWSPCGRYLASASFDSTICIWKRNLDDSSWSMSVQLEGHENEVKSVSWSKDGKFLASCGRDRSVWIWERAQDSNDKEGCDDYDILWDCSDVKNDHTKDVKHVVWHPNQNILVSCSYDDTIRMFHHDENEWKSFETLTGHSSTVWSIDFSESGEYLVTCSDDRSIKIWLNNNHDKLPQVIPKSWKCVTTLQGYHSRSIYDVSWCKKSDIIASCSGDNSIVLYKRSDDPNDESNFVTICRYQDAHTCDINSVAWNPKVVGLLASGADDETIKLWNYIPDGKGRPLPIMEDLLQRVTKSFEKIVSPTNNIETIINEYKTILTDYSQFLNIVSNLQLLQENLEDLYQDIEAIHKLFDLDFGRINQQQPVIVTNLTVDTDFDGGKVSSLSIDLHDRKRSELYRYHLQVDKSKFQLYLPKRTHKLFRLANDMFLIEKTGDFYRISSDGQSVFLLGHLFSLTDIKLITSQNQQTIDYIISADRGEKIRITNYPETYKIERYGFGHQHPIRRLVIVDSTTFISIDQEEEVCLWNLSGLKTMNDFDVFKPDKILSMKENANKKIRSS